MLIELKSVTRDKDRLYAAALREIMAGKAPPSAADLVALTPPINPGPEASQ